MNRPRQAPERPVANDDLVFTVENLLAINPVQSLRRLAMLLGDAFD